MGPEMISSQPLLHLKKSQHSITMWKRKSWEIIDNVIRTATYEHGYFCTAKYLCDQDSEITLIRIDNIYCFIGFMITFTALW